MSKHTKGPWMLERPTFGERHIYVYSHNTINGKNMRGMGRQHICALPYEGKKGSTEYHEMFEANANLISLAPELLEKLEEVVDMAEGAMRLANMDGAEYDQEEWLADAKSLIKRAMTAPTQAHKDDPRPIYEPNRIGLL